MKKTVSIQDGNRSRRLHGMYGSTHTEDFRVIGLKKTGLFGIAGSQGKRLGTGSSAVSASEILNRRKPIRTVPTKGRALSLGEEDSFSLASLGKVITLRGILLFLLAALTVSAAVVLMMFNFEKAVIYGNTKYSQKQIESYITRGRLGDNTFVMALKYHHRTVEDMPFIDQIDIDIASPSTVRVNIKEKPLDGCVILDDTNVFFSKEGIVQTISIRNDEKSTIVKGLILADPETGAPLAAKNQTGLDKVLNLLCAMDRYHVRADSIDVDERDNLTAHFGDVEVRVGKTGYDGKMYKMHQISPYLGDRTGVISMTGADYMGENIVLSSADREKQLASGSGKGREGRETGPSSSGEDPGQKESAKAPAKGKTEKQSDEKAETKKEKTEKQSGEKAETKKEKTEKQSGEKAEKQEGKKAEDQKEKQGEKKSAPKTDEPQGEEVKEAKNKNGSEAFVEKKTTPSENKEKIKESEKEKEKEAQKAREAGGEEAEKAEKPARKYLKKVS